MRISAMSLFSATAVAMTLSASVAAADLTLMGREVTFNIQTYDDPANPLFSSKVQTTTVTSKPEFGLRYEREVNELDVVPIRVDISDTRIEFVYTEDFDNELYKAAFNGYVLTFAGPCVKLDRVSVDRDFTNLPIDNKRVRVDGTTVMVNVSGQVFKPGSQIGLFVDLSPCG